MKIIKFFFVLCLFFFLTFPVFAEDNEIIYCVPNKLDKTQGYILNLLRLSLEITNKEYGTLKAVPYEHQADSISRRIRQVVRGKTDIVWAVTNTKLEKELVPVRIPLHKGVYGFRLFLIKKNDQPRFDKVREQKDLSNFIIGQAHDSDDIAILKHAGFKVEKSSSYDGTFMMLAHNRFDCLPKSISEIFIELEQFGKQMPSLKIEDNLVLYYHQPIYFFSNDNKLAKRIEGGLEKMLKDGSFDDCFNAQYKDLLVKANVAGRRILRIDTPLLETRSLPLDRKELWYSVMKDAGRSGIVINLAGKQRMLTQKMSKEILLAALGTDVNKNINSLKATSGLFDKTLKGLHYGSKELNLPPTRNLNIIKELDKVKALWTPFFGEIKKIIKTRKVNAKQVESIAQKNIPLLEQVNTCVWFYETESGKAGVTHDPFLASAINLAGRQRMLSQKMTKEYLLIAFKCRIPENQLLLQKTYSLFDHTLNGLIDGDEVLRLRRTEKLHIRKQLMKVKALWQEFKPILAQASKAFDPRCEPEAIKKIAESNLQLLKMINTAVEMYEKEAG